MEKTITLKDPFNDYTLIYSKIGLHLCIRNPFISSSRLQSLSLLEALFWYRETLAMTIKLNTDYIN